MLGWNRINVCRNLRGEIKGDMKVWRNDERKCSLQKVPNILREVVSLFYPPRCPVCDRILQPGLMLCAGCRGKIQTVREPVCKRCGKPMEDASAEYCGDCAKREHTYRQGKAVFVYREGICKSMYRFKYGGRREYAVFYAREAVRLYGGWVKKCGVEAIVPIPMYEPKRRRRGYNQAEVFAKELGRGLTLPVESGLIRRVRGTVPQKELNDRERKHNLKNAFQLTADIVKYKYILLVDDIYTTGSTMDEAAGVLLSGGVSHIYYICISIGMGF